MEPSDILCVFGTRPEAIKMAPLVRVLQADPHFRVRVCTTGQHRSMLAQVMDVFGLRADFALDAMQPGQSLNALTARLLDGLDALFAAEQPTRVLVHGDTTTAHAAALAAFHRRIPVGHVEAGLRTGDLGQPFPEEMNRRAIDGIADLLFAPTPQARAHLAAENLPGRVHVTGNTVIDALHLATARLAREPALAAALDAALPALGAGGRRVLLVTGHRRENFGDGFAGICEALARLAARDDIDIAYPVHLNPHVLGPVRERLGGLPRVHLLEPLDYLPFVRLMQRAHAVLTDSGGVQEEAPALGKPVLVMRSVTERPEAVRAGTVRLVGTEPAAIAAAVSALWDTPAADGDAAARVRRNPYGDGRASERIAAALAGRPYTAFAPLAASDSAGDAAGDAAVLAHRRRA